MWLISSLLKKTNKKPDKSSPTPTAALQNEAQIAENHLEIYVLRQISFATDNIITQYWVTLAEFKKKKINLNI